MRPAAPAQLVGCQLARAGALQPTGGLADGVAWLHVSGELHAWTLPPAAPRHAACAAPEGALCGALLSETDGLLLFAAVAGELLVSGDADLARAALPTSAQPSALLLAPGDGGGALALLGFADGALLRCDASPDGSSSRRRRPAPLTPTPPPQARCRCSRCRAPARRRRAARARGWWVARWGCCGPPARPPSRLCWAWPGRAWARAASAALWF